MVLASRDRADAATLGINTGLLRVGFEGLGGYGSGEQQSICSAIPFCCIQADWEREAEEKKHPPALAKR